MCAVFEHHVATKEGVNLLLIQIVFFLGMYNLLLEPLALLRR